MHKKGADHAIGAEGKPVGRVWRGLVCDASGARHFSPLLMVLTSVPAASSPLNSQKNAPPRFCAFT